MPPQRLMIAFACERRGFGVTSGISATAGERNVAIAISTKRRITMYTTRLLMPASVLVKFSWTSLLI